MIDTPDDQEKYLIFKALARMIDTNSGTGFVNNDQGHPAYTTGANGNVPGEFGDGPQQNRLFKLLASFSLEFHREGPNLATWKNFCAYAVAAHNRAHGYP